MYMVNIVTDPDTEIKQGAWAEVEAESYQDAALKMVGSAINFYAPFGTVWARVHGPADAKYPDGRPGLIHQLEMRINGTEAQP